MKIPTRTVIVKVSIFKTLKFENAIYQADGMGGVNVYRQMREDGTQDERELAYFPRIEWVKYEN
jgi:hypothetical protein